VGFDFDNCGLAGEPMAVAAPRPVFGIFDEFALYWIAVDVAKLLRKLALREDVEIVITVLPEAGTVALETL
jgi:hypothetical protein